MGVDLGVRHLAVLADSTGDIRYVPNPGHYGNALARLRRLSRRVSRRQGPDRRAAAPRRGGGSRPTPNATGSTTGSRTCAPTPCTNSPPRSGPNTPRWWSRI
ncbi:transposase [Catellatospora bangladeshensis]|uniref:transposase n=1 Tax=Catellatospora bangladeshensis TaxID=310355 RepID=UPI00361A877D